MRLLGVLLAVLSLLVLGCSSSNQTTAQSGERGGSGSGSGSGPGDSDFCAQLEEMSGGEMSVEDDPEAAREVAAQIRSLADSAPPEVADALEVFAGLVDTMAELDPSDGEEGLDAFGQMMELMFSPEVIEASATLEAYLVDECGVDPTEAAGIFGDDGLSTGDPGSPDDSPPEGSTDVGGGGEGATGEDDPSDISLDDIDELEEANAGAAWVDKVTSTGIANDRYISLTAMAGSEDAFTPEEAVEACDAVRTAFEDRQPQLEVEVLNGETVVASGSAGVPCSAA